MLKTLIKTCACCYVIITYTALALLARLLIQDPMQRRDFYIKYVSRSCKVLIAAMGIEVLVDGWENIDPNQSYLIVGNHLGYIDPLAMSAMKPMCFVTSVEMRETPILGLLTELGGCIYVERRSKDNIRNEIASIVDALKRNYSVVVYPEATSTNGSGVKPFKKSMFEAAVESKKPVLPIVVQFTQIDGKPITAQNRDTVCWYGDLDFGPHFKNLMRTKRVKMRLSILPPIESAGKTRDELALLSYEKINSIFEPFI